MSRFKFPILLSLAVAALAWTTAPVLAARSGRGGGGGRGGVSRGVSRGGVSRGVAVSRGSYVRGGSISRGVYARGGYAYGRRGYGYGGYYPGYGYGLGGYGYGGYGLGGYGYGGYGYGLGGYYPGYDYGYTGPVYIDPTIDSRQSGYYSPPRDNSAAIHLSVPSGAKVWVDDSPTKQSGQERNFVTPPLKTGKTFSYQIKAQWMENGTPVEQTRTVKVRANETSNVDFLSRSAD